MNQLPTLAARLTPAGRAAIATILVHGPAATQSVDRFFEPRGSHDLRQADEHRILFGVWSSVDAGASGEEVVVCKTAVDAFELHCHGGQAATQAILDSLATVGCQLVAWQDLQGPDSIQRECRVALAVARTETVAAILMDQYRGALHAALRRLDESLQRHEIARSLEQLRDLCQHRRVGLHLTEPWRVVLAGAPNVGKSSLINALVGFERAIVFDQPGTTRDVVTAHTVLDGWPIEFADTAGIRSPREPVEAAGVQQAVDHLRQSDLILHVIDATAPDVRPTVLEPYRNVLTVISKIDLREDRHFESMPVAAVMTSAVTGEGVDQLLAEIGRRLVERLPAPGAALPFNARQYRNLDAAAAALEAGDLARARQCVSRILGGRFVTDRS